MQRITRTMSVLALLFATSFSLVQAQCLSSQSRHSSNKAFLGIYPAAAEGGGILVTGVVAGTAAENAGLQKGDIITAMGGVDLVENTLTSTLAGFTPGDAVKLVYYRDGKKNKTQVKLTEKPRHRTYRAHRQGYDDGRDPCKVFIGINMSGHGPQEEGVLIRSIIPNTPAEKADLYNGDVVLALDGVKVNTYSEVLRERNKHNPGDWFTLTVLRDGEEVVVDAQFKSCDEVKEKAIEEKTVPQEKVTERERPETPALDNDLRLEYFNTFPNPTVDKVKVEFSGQAVPTSIRIMDATGKAIYTEELPKFDGEYNNTIDLDKITRPGTYLLNIRQGEKVLTKQLVLVARV